MQQKIVFLGGMNSDVANELVSPQQARYRLNVRILSSNDNNEGAIETVNGNVLVSYNLPSGSNTVIGSVEDQLQRKNYYFVWNSNSNHSILEFDQTLNAINLVFSSPILNFSSNHLITGINVVKLTDTAHLLYWTDNFNQPRKINIEKGKFFMQGNYMQGYKTPFEPLIINRIKQPPLFPPTYTWDGGGFSTQIVNASFVGPQLLLGSTNAKIQFIQNPPNVNFNNISHRFIVTTTGVYNLSVIINISTFIGYHRIVLQKNGITIFQKNLQGGVNFVDVPNLSLIAGTDALDWWVENLSVSSIQFSNAVFKSSLINPQINDRPNYLFKKLYKFKYRYVYDDYEKSAFSPISNYVYPNVLMDIQTEDSIVSQNDKITLEINTGNSIVTKIEIAAKELNETAFGIIATLDKEELGLSDNAPYFYDFYGNNISLPIVGNDDIKLFDSVPLLSQSQEVIKGERLTDGLITEGFDPVPINVAIDLDYQKVETPSGTEHYPAKSYPKTGGKYIAGIVYYNISNQSGATNIRDYPYNLFNSTVSSWGTQLNIPFLNDSNYGIKDMAYVPIVTMNIYHTPPDWATHYQIVRTGNIAYLDYLQFVVNQVEYLDESGNTTSAATAVKVRVDFTNIDGSAVTSYKSLNPNSILTPPIEIGSAGGGTLDLGTRIRFIANRSNTDVFNTDPFLSFNDNAIVEWNKSSNGKAVIIIPDGNSVLRQLADGALCEIYNPSPSLSSNEVFTYECGACFAIETDSNGFKYHTGDVQNQTYNSQGSTINPAIVKIDGWDTFRRRQYMPHLSGALYAEYFVESMNVNNMYQSVATNIGRVNNIDPNSKRITRPSTIRYSELFVPETFINGLSSVYDTNFETYEQKYGGIYKMYNENQELKIFQETKIGAVLVQQVTFNDYKGQDTVGASPSVLANQVIYYNGEFGIGKYPESFAKYGNAKYGIDVRRGVVWRLSNDGLTPISEYFQHNYFTALCKQILQSNQKVNIFGVYDIRFGEYIISISSFTYNRNIIPAQTLAFNEENNVWSTFYSYIPENMVGNGVNIITFKNGALWKHNENPVQNNFYGVQYPSEIHVLCNENPSNVKVLEAISEESNSAWEVYEITTPNGQKSNLIASDFQQIENMQYAAVLRDENTPNTPNNLPLIEGDVLRDTTFLAKFRYNLTNFNKIFAVNFKYIVSNLHNK